MNRKILEESMKIKSAEEVAKNLSWSEIFTLFEAFGYHGFTNTSDFQNAKSKLILNRIDSITKSEFTEIKGALKSSESKLVKYGQNDMAKLMRAIYREHKGYNKLKDKFGGCYIATAVYGSYNSPEVRVLRKFRDAYLEKRFLGRKFIILYYKYSPNMANELKNKKKLNSLVRKILDIIIKILIENVKYENIYRMNRKEKHEE